MNSFSNEDIDVSLLPRYQSAVANPVNPKYWNVMVIHFLVSFLLLAGGMVASIMLWPLLQNYIWVLALIFFLLGIIIFFLLKKSFLHRGYVVRQHDFIYKHGWLSKVTTIIPFNRIQHVAINEGVLSRRYRLAQLQIFTAGGSSSDIKVSGILKEDAEKIKEWLMQKIVGNSIDATQNTGSL